MKYSHVWVGVLTIFCNSLDLPVDHLLERLNTSNPSKPLSTVALAQGWSKKKETMMKTSDMLRNTKLAVTLIRSTIGTPESQRKTVKALGLRKLNHTRVHNDGLRVWGMLEKVIHLVKIQRILVEHADKVPKKPNGMRVKYRLTRWADLPYR